MKTSNSFLAVLLLMTVVLIAGCASPGKRTAIGAGGGAGAGAAIGGAIGGWKGAGIGALAGAAAGGAVGNYLDKQKQELEKVAETKRVKDGLLVKLKNDLVFDTGSSDVKPEAARQLDELGQVLAKYKDDRIRINGYTDDVGSAADNETLAKNRADAVRDVLLSHGVDPGQLISTGFGESRPVASNKTAQGRSRNRRVELAIDVPGAPPERAPAANDSAK
ncbi:MAG: OmpA family protein [Deltaproteobacteria bacterium]|nr:OmpA family protein [Deltaproteobacteria bacterium]